MQLLIAHLCLTSQQVQSSAGASDTTSIDIAVCAACGIAAVAGPTVTPRLISTARIKRSMRITTALDL
jgi:hypothetical protein